MSKESIEFVPPFYQRFNIVTDVNDVRKRFINRSINKIHGAIPELEELRVDREKPKFVMDAFINVAAELGVEYEWNKLFSSYSKTDFNSCLLSLEALYKVYKGIPDYSAYAEKVNDSIKYAISLCETDIGVAWRDGAFWPSGAKLLDEALVNDNLRWLAGKSYHSVLVPFEKGIRHYLEAIQKPERLGDTVTDVYEAVEALAKSVTGRDRDLSANSELFVSKLNLSDYYKKMLKDYIEYANEYRHSAELGKAKKPPSRNEVEAFIYTSGFFIRLAIQQLS